jgi:uncharacterized protein
MGAAREPVLITGASTGIGLELARVFAREGHDLVISARSLAALERVQVELASRHPVAVHPVAADLAEPDGADRLVAGVRAAGVSPGILVNNAGFGLFGPFAETPLEREQQMIQVNVTALVTLTKRYVPEMLARRRGRVLNVASIAGFVPGPGMSVYYATKAFVISFSDAIAEELAGTGVTVTALCPGPTRSRFQETARLERSRIFEGHVMDAAPVAEAGYRGLLAGARVVVPGVQNKAVPLFARLAPRRLVTAVVRRRNEPK